MARKSGRDLNDFVKMFLATYKMMGDADFQKKREKLYDARIAELEAKTGERSSVNESRFQNWLKENFGGARSEGSGQAGASGGPSGREMYAHLIDKGASPNEAQFLTSSAISESGLNPGAVHDNGTGYGMFGHRDPSPGQGRKTDLFNFAGTKTPDWKQQSEFALKELRASPQSKLVNDAKTPEDLTRAQVHFLRPQGYTPDNPENSRHYDKRLNTMRTPQGGASEPPKTPTEPKPPAAIPTNPAAPKPQAAIPTTEAIPASAEAPTYGDNDERSPVEVAYEGDSGPVYGRKIDALLRKNDDEEFGGNKDVRVEDAGYTGSAPDLGVEVWDAAEGGAIPAAPPSRAPQVAEAPLGEVLGAALHDVQDTYGLGEERAALPGTDGARNARLNAFHANEQALAPDQFKAVLDMVDPDGTAPNRNGLAMQKLYSFHAARGDKEAAAKAAGGVLGAARRSSMEYGQDAINAMGKRDLKTAANMLFAAYNEIPDGREVTGEVNAQGMGRATVYDIATGKPAQQMQVTPGLMAEAAQKLANGSQFYTQLAPLAAPRQRPQRALMAAGGSMVVPVSQDDDEHFDNMMASGDGREDPEIEDARELGSDEETSEPQSAIPTSSPPPADVSESGGSSESPPASGDAGVAPAPKKPAAPKYVAPEDWMNPAQRKIVDAMNKREMEVHRQEMMEYRRQETQYNVAKNQDANRRQRLDLYNQGQTARVESQNKALAARQEAADKAAAERLERAARQQAAIDERARRLEQQRQVTQQQAEHNRRMKDDPEYARSFELGQIDQQQSAIPRNVPGRSESAQAAMEARYGNETDRRMLEEKRLGVGAKGRERDEYLGKEFDERIEPYQAALDKLLKEGEVSAKNGKVDERLLPTLDNNQKSAFLDLVDRVASKNNVSPNTIVRSLFDATQLVNPQNEMRITRDGRVQIGRERIVMERDDFRRLAEIRADNLEAFKAAAAEKQKLQKAAEEKQRVGVATRRQTVDDIDAAGSGIGVAPNAPAAQRASGARGKYYMRRYAEELGAVPE